MTKQIERVLLKQAIVAVRYPHHYVNACWLTICAALFGELKVTVVCFFWLYALGENVLGGENWDKKFHFNGSEEE